MLDPRRRTFLKSLGYLTSLVVLEGIPLNALAAFGDRAQLPVVIGDDYLAQFGQEPELSELNAWIEDSADSFFEKPQLVEKVREQVKSDYLNGQVFKWNRWVLSRTEGRLCALASLKTTRSQ